MVGTSKIMPATFLLAAVFWPAPAVAPALLKAAFMLVAQIAHFRARYALVKYVPSFLRLGLSLVIAQLASGTAYVTRSTLLALASSVLLMASGVSCFVGPDVRREFGRVGLNRIRILTRGLELLGAGGLLVGLWWPPARRLAAGRLALLMLAAVAIRVRQRDALRLMLLAAVLAGVNGLILAGSLRRQRLQRP